MRNKQFSHTGYQAAEDSIPGTGKTNKEFPAVTQFIARDQCMEVESRQNLAGVHELRNGTRGLGV